MKIPKGRLHERMNGDEQKSQAVECYVQDVKLGADGGALAKVWSTNLRQPAWIKAGLPSSVTLEAAAAAAAKGRLLARRGHASWVLAIEREPRPARPGDR
jgi:hypothetical protein